VVHSVASAGSANQLQGGLHGRRDEVGHAQEAQVRRMDSVHGALVVVVAQQAGAVTLNYGMFINKVISFLIVAFALFLIIRSMNRMKRKAEAPVPAPATKDCPYCATAVPIKAVRCPHCTSELGK
jgi:predicted Zn-ribbon and HTH transcriptional regulator